MGLGKEMRDFIDVCLEVLFEEEENMDEEELLREFSKLMELRERFQYSF